MPSVPELARELILAADGLRPELVRVLSEGGITPVLLTRPDEALARACREARIQVLPAESLPFGGLPEIARAGPGAPVVFTGGAAPGVTRVNAGSDAAIAGATGQVWMDANIHWVAWLRALYPGRPAFLGQALDKSADAATALSLDTLELALTEARVAGGNRVLALAPQHREALLKGDPKAVAAWKRLGQTSAWLRENAPLFGRPVDPAVTQLVDAEEAAAELANLMYRNSVSPRLVDAANPPAPDPARIRVLVAAGIRPPGAALRSRILAHAGAGTTVVVDEAGKQPWWRVPELRTTRTDEDRRFYALGRGQLVAYNEPVADPGSFALDVIDLVSHKRRAVRIWDAPAAIAVATSGPDGGTPRARAVVGIVNYGSPVAGEVLVHVQGAFSQAVLLRPESPPANLKTARRGSATEISLPELRRVAAVLFT